MKEILFVCILVFGIIISVIGFMLSAMTIFDKEVNTRKSIILFISTIILTIVWIVGCAFLI